LTAERSKTSSWCTASELEGDAPPIKEARKYQARVVVYPTELKKLVVVVSLKNVHNINNSNHKCAPSPFSSLHLLNDSINDF
jgi:hypothetical protein